MNLEMGIQLLSSLEVKVGVRVYEYGYSCCISTRECKSPLGTNEKLVLEGLECGVMRRVVVVV